MVPQQQGALPGPGKATKGDHLQEAVLSLMGWHRRGSGAVCFSACVSCGQAVLARLAKCCSCLSPADSTAICLKDVERDLLFSLLGKEAPVHCLRGVLLLPDESA